MARPTYQQLRQENRQLRQENRQLRRRCEQPERRVWAQVVTESYGIFEGRWRPMKDSGPCETVREMFCPV